MSAASEALSARAQQQTGLADFGPGDWRVGFERLVDAMVADVGHDPDATSRIEAIIVDRLVRRLRIEDWYAHHGDEAAPAIEGPLMVLGTGRSGTTATHYLLAVDPRFRYLRKWEIESPVPPPDLATERDDPRRPAAVEQTVHHIVTVDGPTEDRKIHELSFHDDGRTIALPSYVDTWRDLDHSGAFPYHERVLRMLQSHRPPYRWLLKAPDHLFCLPALHAQYPDIRYVMTHRDPVKVVPSVCSVTMEHTRRRLPDWSCDKVAFGREFLVHLSEGIRRFLRFRDDVGDACFVDVGQPELNADPIAIAERVYDVAGYDLDDDLRAAMRSWSEQNRAGARGEHRYTAEEFGLTDEMIREAFAEYLDRFGSYCVPR